MAYTYSGNPNASAIDMVHFRMGNTNPGNVIATDEECVAMLHEHRGNTYLAAAAVLETKALEFLYRPTTVKKGDRTTSYADQAQAFLATARQLRSNASLATATVYAGGLSVVEKDADRHDTGLVQPFARKHLHMPRHWSGPDVEEREA